MRDALSKSRERKKKEVKSEWEREEIRRLAEGKRPRRTPAFPTPRLTQEERRHTRSSVPPATLLDYLYRLRIRANYEDAAVFTDGPETSEQSRAFRRDLCILASTTMLMSELAISRTVGKAQLLNWVDTWSRSVARRGARVGLLHRRDALAKFG
jgi:hypothetical protein